MSSSLSQLPCGLRTGLSTREIAAEALLFPAAPENSAPDKMTTRLEELRNLSPRLESALCAAQVTGVKLLQVWPNGEHGLPALGLFGECDAGSADRLHVAMAGFIKDLEASRVAYTTERMGKAVSVRPWAHYNGPK